MSTPRSKQAPDTTTPAPERSGGGDPFPRDRFVGLVGRLPRYLRLALGLVGDPRLPRSRRAAVLAAAAYLASPVDLVPGVIPVVGQLDDIAVALLALRTAVRALDPETRSRQLDAAGLAPGDLDADLVALGEIAGWLVRRGIAIGRRLALLAASASLAAARAGMLAARRGAPVVARSGVRLGRTAGGSLARASRGAAGAFRRRLRGDEGGDPGPG